MANHFFWGMNLKDINQSPKPMPRLLEHTVHILRARILTPNSFLQQKDKFDVCVQFNTQDELFVLCTLTESSPEIQLDVKIRAGDEILFGKRSASVYDIDIVVQIDGYYSTEDDNDLIETINRLDAKILALEETLAKPELVDFDEPEGQDSCHQLEKTYLEEKLIPDKMENIEQSKCFRNVCVIIILGWLVYCYIECFY